MRKGWLQMKRILIGLLAVLLVVMSVGCSSTPSKPAPSTTPAETPADSPGAAEEPAAEGPGCKVAEDADIVVLNYSDISTFFPANQTQVSEGVPSSLAYESLLAFDDNMQLKWILAEGVDVSEDGLVYTFKLREGITFSDGTPWNAEAVKANFDLITDDSYGFKGVSRLQVIRATEVIDEYTVAVALENPYAPFLNVVANFSGFVSPSLIEKGQDAWSNEIIGTGMYTLTDYRSGESMVFTLKRDYWGYDPEIAGDALLDGNIGFNTITIKPVSEEATRIAMLLAGEADIINWLTATNIAMVEGSGMNIVTKPGVMIGYMYFNTAKGPLADVRVRQALTMAVDVEALNEVVYGGRNIPGDSIAAPSVSYYVAQKRYEYNIEKAKALLAEAGYADGFTLVAWEENDTSDIQRGEFIQQQLEQVGVKLDVYPMEGGVLATEVSGYSGAPEDAGWDIYIRGYSASTFDPDQALGRFTTPQYPPKGANYSFYSNPVTDELATKGAKTTDPDERAAIYKEMQEILWEEMPAVPLLVNTYIGATNEKVEGFSFLGGGGFYWRNAVYVSE